MSELTYLTKSALKHRAVFTRVFEYSLLGGIVMAMAIGIIRLQ